MGNNFYQTKQVQSILLNWMKFGGNLNTFFLIMVCWVLVWNDQIVVIGKFSRDKLLPTNDLKHFKVKLKHTLV